jgi:hypothetical protein
MNFMKTTENVFLRLGILILQQFVNNRISHDSAKVYPIGPYITIATWRLHCTIVCSSAWLQLYPWGSGFRELWGNMLGRLLRRSLDLYILHFKTVTYFQCLCSPSMEPENDAKDVRHPKTKVCTAFPRQQRESHSQERKKKMRLTLRESGG